MTRNSDTEAAARILREAGAWFVRMHADVFRLVDYVSFLGWLTRDERHRRSYRRMQTLWHNAPSLQEIDTAIMATRGQRSIMGLSDEWMQCICPVNFNARAPSPERREAWSNAHLLNLPASCLSW